MLSDSALLSLQLSVKHARQEGKISASAANCVASLDQSKFAPVFETAVKNSFNAGELEEAERFLQSPAGVKYAKSGLLHVYEATGEPMPEPQPKLSLAESQEFERFRETSAGDKLMKRIMRSPDVARLLEERTRQVLSECQ